MPSRARQEQKTPLWANESEWIREASLAQGSRPLRRRKYSNGTRQEPGGQFEQGVVVVSFACDSGGHVSLGGYFGHVSPGGLAERVVTLAAAVASLGLPLRKDGVAMLNAPLMLLFLALRPLPTVAAARRRQQEPRVRLARQLRRTI